MILGLVNMGLVQIRSQDNVSTFNLLSLLQLVSILLQHFRIDNIFI
jgi:hypothetical protein